MQKILESELLIGLCDKVKLAVDKIYLDNRSYTKNFDFEAVNELEMKPEDILLLNRNIIIINDNFLNEFEKEGYLRKSIYYNLGVDLKKILSFYPDILDNYKIDDRINEYIDLSNENYRKNNKAQNSKDILDPKLREIISNQINKDNIFYFNNRWVIPALKILRDKYQDVNEFFSDLPEYYQDISLRFIENKKRVIIKRDSYSTFSCNPIYGYELNLFIKKTKERYKNNKTFHEIIDTFDKISKKGIEKLNIRDEFVNMVDNNKKKIGLIYELISNIYPISYNEYIYLLKSGEDKDFKNVSLDNFGSYISTAQYKYLADWSCNTIKVKAGPDTIKRYLRDKNNFIINNRVLKSKDIKTHKYINATLNTTFLDSRLNTMKSLYVCMLNPWQISGKNRYSSKSLEQEGVHSGVTKELMLYLLKRIYPNRDFRNLTILDLSYELGVEYKIINVRFTYSSLIELLYYLKDQTFKKILLKYLSLLKNF